MSLLRMLSSPGFVAAAVAGAVASGACAGNGTGPESGNATPAAIAVSSGNNQTGTAGAVLGSPLVVLVTNSDGDALPNVGVSWTVVSGGGTLAGSSSTTNAQGLAQMTYTLGGTAGANTVRAAVTSNTSLSTTFTATGEAPPVDQVPASIEISAGNNQSATVNQPLGNPLSVVVKNAGGTPLANISVSWAVTSGGGALGSPTSTTNASGIASNTFTAGANPGASTVTASVTSNNALSVSFSATATAIVNGAVSVDDNFFNPDAVTVSVGGTVTWTWVGSAQHNVTWVSGGFSNSATQTSGSHPVTFNSAGTFSYYCTIHGTANSGMRGSVTAQ